MKVKTGYNEKPISIYWNEGNKCICKDCYLNNNKDCTFNLSFKSILKHLIKHKNHKGTNKRDIGYYIRKLEQFKHLPTFGLVKYHKYNKYYTTKSTIPLESSFTRYNNNISTIEFINPSFIWFNTEFNTNNTDNGLNKIQ